MRATKTPGEASAQGPILALEHPEGGLRYAAHLFDMSGGGIAWLDHGWTEPLVSYHVCHFVEGFVSPDTENNWLLKTAEGYAIPIWVDRSSNLPDGDRDSARLALTGEFDLNLLKDK